MSDLKEEGFMINYSDTLPSPPAGGSHDLGVGFELVSPAPCLTLEMCW